MPKTLALLLALVALAAVAAPAGAAGIPGENGRIVFTSGRDLGDAFARLHMVAFSPLPTVSPAFTTLTTEQHKHASWSPDRTRVAYSRGNPSDFKNEDFEIYVQDMTTGQVTPVTTDDTQTSERPAFSPDGTRLAYEEEVGNNDGSRDIFVLDLATGQRTNITSDVAKPATKATWTPDSSEIYFTIGDPTGVKTLDVVRRNADGSGEVRDVLTDQNVSEFQHSISPDGRHLCWTEGNGFDSSTDVFTGPIQAPGANKLNLSDDPAKGDINCTWAPEGDEILYVKGIFNQAKLVLAQWPDTEIEVNVTDDQGANDFDGNPDWAIDGRPTCPDVTVQTRVDTPVTIPTVCTDTGPDYERTPVREVLTGEPPANGTATDPLDDDSEKSTYTPKAGFVGTDTYAYRGFDIAGFSEGRGTITVRVLPPATGPGQGPGPGPGGDGPVGDQNGQTPPPPPPAVRCAGRAATIVGTAGRNVIRGTNERDVIAALGGNDVVLGRGGNDVICLGAGNDRGSGGAGADRIFGGAGRDRLVGGPARDVLVGGAGKDRRKQ